MTYEPGQRTPQRDAQFWIERLRLQPHPEGGFYKEAYRDTLLLQPTGLPAEFSGPRSASTAIYFLLEGHQFSGFHRIRSDELWHFYTGSALAVHVIGPDGQHEQLLIGPDPEAGQQFQGAVKANRWFASELLDKSDFALVGCTVAPGFDFADFELAERDTLARSFPEHRSLIERLTHG